MERLIFRDLRADEIDVRVGKVTKKGVVLLLYKDARVDMDILDETLGKERWQRKHYELKGNLFCSVGIKFDEWVWKDDCGAESFSEKEKGEASDSFKRACFNWGIGRELYTAPFLFVPCKTNAENKNGRTVYVMDNPYVYFKVESIKIENKKIKDLSISMDGKIVIGNNATSEPKDIKVKMATAAQIKRIKELVENLDAMFDYYKVAGFEEMTEKIAAEIIKKKAG